MNIRDIIRKQILSELDLSTYAKLRSLTSDWPWSKFFASGNEEGEKRAKKMGRINNKSQELFEREFYKRFKPGDIKITVISPYSNKPVELTFKSLSWLSNWTNYVLNFQTPFNSNITVHGDSKGRPYILNSEGWKLDSYKDYADKEIKIEPQSIDLLNQMFEFRHL